MADHHPLAGTVYTGAVIRTPKKMMTGSGAPSFCWQCGNQLQRAPGKGAGLFFFNLVTGPDDQPHRVHGDCTEQAILDGCKLAPPADAGVKTGEGSSND
jgi:hypothetical protein